MRKDLVEFICDDMLEISYNRHFNCGVDRINKEVILFGDNWSEPAKYEGYNISHAFVEGDTLYINKTARCIGQPITSRDCFDNIEMDIKKIIEQFEEQQEPLY